MRGVQPCNTAGHPRKIGNILLKYGPFRGQHNSAIEPLLARGPHVAHPLI